MSQTIIANRPIAGRITTPWYRTQRARSVIKATVVYALILPGAVLFMLPLLWMLSTALKPSKEIYVYPLQWIPSELMWSNFVDGWTSRLDFTQMLFNSLVITLNNVVGNLISCCLAAYGFARLRAPGKNILFALVLATMLLPNEVTIIPQYVLFIRFTQAIEPFWPAAGFLWFFHLSWLPLMIPAWFGWPFFIFLLRQFFMSIPHDLDEAARLDGASSWRILWSVLLPLAKPALAAVVIFAFLGNWNNFLSPLIYIRRQDEQVLAVGLNMFRGMYGNIEMHYMMAVALIVLLPVLVIGIALTGIKG